jgi:hypothetical protein
MLYAWLLSGISIAVVSAYGMHRWDEGQYAIAQAAAEKAQITALANAAKDAEALGITEGQITFTAGQDFSMHQTQIVTRTVTLIREVPVYVTPKAVAACVVPRGFVELHNNAARPGDTAAAVVSGAPPELVDAPSGVGLDTVASTIITNYGRCNSNAAQLAALEKWATEAIAAYNASAPK